ncbi:MAG TPA: 3-hydroxyacyl-CoA dehydrogenase NAD-binding domain-containing protein, partial [Nitriliruptoraceae bacterium]|nr:3-hydroxyacyl-CoA dehydrogenase NAD-binding domain-containing protein [Nitriliruptoraceae bacterium]
MTSSTERVGVVGCGSMGAGIAEIVARNGLQVRFVEIDEEAVEAGFSRIRRSLDRQVRRERLSAEQAEEIAARIDGSADWTVLGDADLVVEAV